MKSFLYQCIMLALLSRQLALEWVDCGPSGSRDSHNRSFSPYQQLCAAYAPPTTRGKLFAAPSAHRRRAQHQQRSFFRLSLYMCVCELHFPAAPRGRTRRRRASSSPHRASPRTTFTFRVSCFCRVGSVGITHGALLRGRSISQLERPKSSIYTL